MTKRLDLIGQPAYTEHGEGTLIDIDSDGDAIVSFTNGHCNAYPLHEITIFSQEPAVQMRNPNRIPEVLQEIALYWQKHPDLRLGQLLGNFNVSYNTEDEMLLERLRDPDYFDRPL